MIVPPSVIAFSVKSLTRIICNVDDRELVNVPDHGPLIIACNHINFIEVPLVFTHLQPRRVTAFAKAETWDNPLMGYLFNLWGAIPLKRGEVDTNAFRMGLNVLAEGKILAITPEGTRSGNGQLRRGLPGIVMIAQRSKVPILPMIYYGSEKLRSNINSLKRTDFHIRVGKEFKLLFPEGRIDRELRGKMVDEIMYQLAKLLPAEYRGYYSDLSKATTDFIEYA
jgi:1-acyl-sn-glycerol-3-phosphate acyltransferase